MPVLRCFAVAAACLPVLPAQTRESEPVRVSVAYLSDAADLPRLLPSPDAPPMLELEPRR